MRLNFQDEQPEKAMQKSSATSQGQGQGKTNQAK